MTKRLLSVASAITVAALMICSTAWGFEGRVPLFKDATPKKDVKETTAVAFDVLPKETREKIAQVDPELLWENWSDSESIPSSQDGALKPLVFPSKKKDVEQGSVLLEFDAIVVWNGLEGEEGRELLIFSSEEKTFEDLAPNETNVELGMIPLTGKPIEIARAGDEFSVLKKELRRKYARVKPSSVKAVSAPKQMNERAPYCAFQLEAKDAVELTTVLNDKLAGLGEVAKVAFEKKDQDVLDDYFKRGINHFVFEVFDVDDVGDSFLWRKTPLAVSFQTPRLFIPRQIGRIGGRDTAAYSLLVLSPDRLKYTGAEDFKPLNYPTSEEAPITFSCDELKEIAPTVAKFCEENKLDSLTIRSLFGRSDLSNVAGDIEFVSRPENSEE